MFELDDIQALCLREFIEGRWGEFVEYCKKYESEEMAEEIWSALRIEEPPPDDLH
ncbi:hypothetical protein [Phytobacter diazotrophicus]|uniref:hypothetical protein n=1 Tax=Phytobacter diazotrophicus TaxID=395631 RepID=UPI002FF831B6